jgi:hypothetical protein
MSFEAYQQMDAASKAGVSTVCKMFNTANEIEFLKWLPTIPKEELRLCRVSDFSLKT